MHKIVAASKPSARADENFQFHHADSHLDRYFVDMLKNLSPYRLWWKISTPICVVAVTWLVQRKLSDTRVLLLSVAIEGLEPHELWIIHLIFMRLEDVVVS